MVTWPLSRVLLRRILSVLCVHFVQHVFRKITETEDRPQYRWKSLEGRVANSSNDITTPCSNVAMFVIVRDSRLYTALWWTYCSATIQYKGRVETHHADGLRFTDPEDVFVKVLVIEEEEEDEEEEDEEEEVETQPS
ncbi:unnamed protein product [Pleuronectes platessa]|uniref:Secreted protein n=1 Tax=Pleuronectes platessa TaxID=8262 RepID=A0A9N7YAA2_PLEPL|nr:unnamed protein product [Pleuronectes platessa]